MAVAMATVWLRQALGRVAEGPDGPAVGGIAALRRVASAVLIDAIDPVRAGGQN